MELRYQCINTYLPQLKRTAPQGHFPAVPQCSSQCRDVNITIATYHNADAIEHERTLNMPSADEEKWHVLYPTFCVMLDRIFTCAGTLCHFVRDN